MSFIVIQDGFNLIRTVYHWTAWSRRDTPIKCQVKRGGKIFVVVMPKEGLNDNSRAKLVLV